MATKSDVREFVAQYQQSNSRPCPKKAIIASQGETAEAFLKELIADGTIGCRRGRNGGYFPIDAAAAVESTPEVASEDVDKEALAESFRALEARLAAEEAAQNETPADESTPF